MGRRRIPVLLSALAVILVTASTDAASALSEPLQHGVRDNGLEVLDDDNTLDIIVPPDVWSLGALRVEPGKELKMSPAQQRLSLPTLASVIPHFKKVCSCSNYMCSCCTSVEIVNKNKTGCVSLAYLPDKLSVVFALSVNNNTIVEREVISGSNPPPICIPIPQLPMLKICLRLSNISLADKQVQVCGILEGGLIGAQPLIRLRLGCVHLGSSGISWSRKPATSTYLNYPDSQIALQNLSAAPNSTDNEEFHLLQSILRRQNFFEQPTTVLSSRNKKMARPRIDREK